MVRAFTSAPCLLVFIFYLFAQKNKKSKVKRQWRYFAFGSICIYGIILHNVTLW